MPKRLQICICGWYFFPDLFKQISRLPRDQFDTLVVAHRSRHTFGLKGVTHENRGLEFGAYCYYLMHHWDKESNLLFLHDDIAVNSNFFEQVAAIPFDQAYIFKNEASFKENLVHGRAIFATAAFLSHVVQFGGIWYDTGSSGFIAKGKSWSETPPPGCKDHNAGIRAFMLLADRIGKTEGMEVNKPYFIEDVRLGRRGQLPLKT